MEKTIKNWVFHVNCGTENGVSDGCGVLVGNLFITAGHVIEHAVTASVYIDHESHRLRKEDAVFYSFYDKEEFDPKGSDIAVFKLEGVEPSPMTLREDAPIVGEELISVSFRRPSKRAKELFGYASNDDEFERVACDARVVELSNNFFACEMSVTLKPGSSGSPVIDTAGRVVGILHGGIDGMDSHCLFQNVSNLAIKNIVAAH